MEARSFQNLPLQYNLVTELGGESAEFRIDSSSGSIQPRKELSLLSAPYESQFRLRVTVREQGGSGRSSTVEVLSIEIKANAETTYVQSTRTQISKPCHDGIHRKALAEYSQMRTYMPGFQ